VNCEFYHTSVYRINILERDSNSKIDNYVDHICPIELVVKDTTDTARSVSYLHLEIDSEDRLRMKLSDKRDDFSFPIVNSSFRERSLFNS